MCFTLLLHLLDRFRCFGTKDSPSRHRKPINLRSHDFQKPTASSWDRCLNFQNPTRSSWDWRLAAYCPRSRTKGIYMYSLSLKALSVICFFFSKLAWLLCLNPRPDSSTVDMKAGQLLFSTFWVFIVCSM